MCSAGGLRRSCSRSLRYCGEIEVPSSLRIRAATSFWLSPARRRASVMVRPNVAMISPQFANPQNSVLEAQAANERWEQERLGLTLMRADPDQRGGAAFDADFLLFVGHGSHSARHGV